MNYTPLAQQGPASGTQFAPAPVYTPLADQGPGTSFGGFAPAPPASSGSSGMAAILPAAIGAASSLGGSVLGGKQQAKATQAQAKSTADALAYQKQTDADRKARYDTAMSAYQQQWQARENNREQLLKRYGVDIGSLGGGSVAGMMGAPAGGPGGPSPTAPSPALPSQAGPAGPPAGGQNVAAMMQPQQLGGWNDWKQQGLGV